MPTTPLMRRSPSSRRRSARSARVASWCCACRRNRWRWSSFVSRPHAGRGAADGSAPGCGAPRGGRKIAPWKEQAWAGPWSQRWSPWAGIKPAALRNVLGFSAFVLAYIIAYHFGMSFNPAVSAPFWFPDSVLLCALLCTRTKWWWLLLLAVLPIRLLIDVPPDLHRGGSWARCISTIAPRRCSRRCCSALSVGSDPSDFHARSRLLLPVRCGARAVAQRLRRCGRPQRAWASVLGQRRAMVPR